MSDKADLVNSYSRSIGKLPFYFKGFRGKTLILWLSKELLPQMSDFSYLAKKFNYVVMAEKEYWGQKFQGVPIISPAELLVKGKNPSVYIFNAAPSYWDTIQKFLNNNQIYNMVPLFMFHPINVFSKEFEELMTADMPKFKPRRNRSAEAILIRGHFEPFFTPLVVKQARLYNPDKTIVLSTWKDTPAALLRELPVDELILNEYPEKPGQGHRNYQIQCVVPGLQYLKEDGVSEVLIQRTDQAFFRPNLIERCQRLQAQYPAEGGLVQKRIIMSDAYFRKYIFYHPSDMFMYGTVDDLLLFWDHPFDSRSKEEMPDYSNILTERMITEEDLLVAAKELITPEGYFFTNMLKKLQYPFNYTLQDWERLVAQIFVIKGLAWWNFYWYKPGKGYDNRVNFACEPYPLHCIGEAEWEDIYLSYQNK